MAAPRKRPGRPSKDEGLKDFQQAIRLGIEFRKKYGLADKWPTYKGWYRNKFMQGIIPVNLTYAMARASIARTRIAEPKVVVTAPNRPELFMHAKLVEAIDNWLLRELEVKRTLKRLSLNAFLMGKAPWVIGYDSEYGYDPELNDPVMEDSTLSGFDDDGDRLEYNANITPGMPWIRQVNPEDFVVPWGLGDFECTPWYAMRFVRPTDEMKRDRKYQHRDEITANLSPDLLPGGPESRRNVYLKMAESGDFTEAYEIHDARTGRVYVLTLDGNHFLRNDEDELQIDGLPAGIVDFNDDPDVFWSVPDAAILEPQQLEINDITTQWSKHRRAAVSKVLARKNVIPQEEIDKMTSEAVKAVVNCTSSDLAKDVKVLEAQIPDDFRIAREMVRQDAREAIGFSRNQLGEFQGKTHVSAQEQAAVERGSEVRVDERRDIMADTLVAMVRKMNQTIFKFWTTERVIQVAGPEGAIHWVKYTGTDLKGEYMIQVDPDAANPTTKESRKLQLAQLAELVIKVGGDPTTIIQQLIAETPGIRPEQVLPGIRPGPQPQSGPGNPMTTKQFTQGGGGPPTNGNGAKRV